MEYKLRLKNVREEKGLSQKEVADLLGIDRTVYTKYENGYELIPIKHLITFCNQFQVSVDFIFSLRYESSCSLEFHLDLVPERLKEWRKSQKITQEKLASFLGTNKSVICNYEKGRHFIATPFIYQICHKYHVSADYLLGRYEKTQED